MEASLSPIDVWVSSLDESQVVARLSEIDRTVDELEAERGLLRQALDLKRKWATRGEQADATAPDEPDTTRPMVAVPEAHLGLDGPAPAGKAAAALRILGSQPGREWSARDVATEMVRLGWMADTQKDLESLASTLSRLAKDRKVHRPRRGAYRLTPSERA